MQVDFSQPQRQSAAGIIINGAYTVQQFVRAMFIPLAFFLIKANKVALFYTILGFVGILIISLIYGYFYYKKFTFYLDTLKQEFIIDKGVFGRKHLTIPIAKIQQVNINQGFLQKLIGVYSLQIDTAGTDSKEVDISAISEKVAYALKEHLLNGKLEAQLGSDIPTSPTSIATTATETPFIKINASTLLKIGLTSNYGRSVVLLMGFAYAVFHNIKELLKTFDNDHGQVEEFFKNGFTLISVTVLFVVIIVILLATNVIRTFVKYFDFQISKHYQSLLISSGLFAKKNTLLSPNKVQVTAYSQNYLQKKIGLFNMVLKQAHAGKEQSDKEVKSNNLEVPGCSTAEKDEIMKMILSKLPIERTTYKPNIRFLNLPILFQVILPIAIFAIFYHFVPSVKPFLPLAIIYVLATITMLYVSYTKHRIMVSEDFIIKQSGIWDIEKEIIEPHKIQSITTSQYPWHRALDIGHITLHTAAGAVSFSYGNFSEIKTLTNWWLYQVEGGKKDWM